MVGKNTGSYFNFFIFFKTCFVFKILSIFEKAPWAAEKNVYYVAGG
jgi:hypothetical protein